MSGQDPISVDALQSKQIVIEHFLERYLHFNEDIEKKIMAQEAEAKANQEKEKENKE